MTERVLWWTCERCGRTGPLHLNSRLHSSLTYVGVGPGSKLHHTRFPPPYGSSYCGKVTIMSRPNDAITQLSRLAEEP